MDYIITKIKDTKIEKICLQHFEMIGKQSGERVRQHLNLQPSKKLNNMHHSICLKLNAESKL